MDIPSGEVILTEDLTTSTSLPKAKSWLRGPRTSCDACKQMKIKCQRTEDESCVRCTARSVQCTITPVEKKKRKLINKNEELEERIKRMESALFVSEMRDPHMTADLGDDVEERNASDQIENQAELSDQLSSLVIDSDGAPNFIGSASGFSLFSPRGFRWISQRVGNNDEVAELVLKLSKKDWGTWGHGDADLWYPIPRSQHSPLPAKHLAAYYIDCYFLTFNSMFPIINQTIFKQYLERQYSSSPPSSIAWYALFNAVLCLGAIRSRSERGDNVKTSRLVDYTSSFDENGVEYFRNAASCFHHLVFKEANLVAMQAMTLMMFITSSSPNPQPAYILTSAAGNLANTLGLHRSSNETTLVPEEKKQRRNVFWFFYLMEKSISGNLGRPSIISDDDIAVELPSKNEGLMLSASGAKVHDIFQDQIRLAIIGTRICSELYSAKSQTKSAMDRMKVLGLLDTHLQQWRDTIPVEIRPEYTINCSDEQYVPIAMMHFQYLDAVIRLHRLPGHHESYKNDGSLDTNLLEPKLRLNPRVYASQSLCLAAARRSIQLLDAFSKNNKQKQHIMWLALYYPLSASLVLFTNILSNPQDQNARTDIQLMNSIASFIDQFVQPGTSFANTPTLSVFKDLCDIAQRLVEREAHQHKRKPRRPLEDSVLDSKDTFVAYPDVRKSVSRSARNDSQQIRQAVHEREDYLSETIDLNFAPFVGFELGTFDFLPTIYDPFPLSSTFDWEMEENFQPDTWASITPSDVHQRFDIER